MQRWKGVRATTPKNSLCYYFDLHIYFHRVLTIKSQNSVSEDFRLALYFVASNECFGNTTFDIPTRTPTDQQRLWAQWWCIRHAVWTSIAASQIQYDLKGAWRVISWDSDHRQRTSFSLVHVWSATVAFKEDISFCAPGLVRTLCSHYQQFYIKYIMKLAIYILLYNVVYYNT